MSSLIVRKGQSGSRFGALQSKNEQEPESSSSTPTQVSEQQSPPSKSQFISLLLASQNPSANLSRSHLRSPFENGNIASVAR